MAGAGFTQDLAKDIGGLNLLQARGRAERRPSISHEWNHIPATCGAVATDEKRQTKSHGRASFHRTSGSEHHSFLHTGFADTHPANKDEGMTFPIASFPCTAPLHMAHRIWSHHLESRSQLFHDTQADLPVSYQWASGAIAALLILVSSVFA